MSEKKFTRTDVWYGGFFELAIEVGSRSDEQLLAVLKAIWSHPNVDGCYLRVDVEPDQQTPLVPEMNHVKEGGYHLRGLANMPNNILIPCGTVAIRETSGIDWLVLYLPMGSLDIAYPVEAYPFVEETSDHDVWIAAIEKWFNDIAQHVFMHLPYKLALIGFEVSGHAYASDIASNGIPDERGIGYLWAEKDILEFYPSN